MTVTGSWMTTLDAGITTAMTSSWATTLATRGSWMTILDVGIITAMTGSWMTTLVVGIITVMTGSWMITLDVETTIKGKMTGLPMGICTEMQVVSTDLEDPWMKAMMIQFKHWRRKAWQIKIQWSICI